MARLFAGLKSWIKPLVAIAQWRVMLAVCLQWIAHFYTFALFAFLKCEKIFSKKASGIFCDAIPLIFLFSNKMVCLNKEKPKRKILLIAPKWGKTNEEEVF